MNDRTALMLVVGAGLAFLTISTARAVQTAAVDTAASIGNAINPLNHDNIFASGVNSVGAYLSGDPNFSLGIWVYEMTHTDPPLNPPPKPGPSVYEMPIFDYPER